MSKERIKLWAHLVSAHAAILSPETPMDDLEELHDHEHEGPCTIRNHPEDSREYSLKKAGRVLLDSED